MSLLPGVKRMEGGEDPELEQVTHWLKLHMLRMDSEDISVFELSAVRAVRWSNRKWTNEGRRDRRGGGAKGGGEEERGRGDRLRASRMLLCWVRAAMAPLSSEATMGCLNWVLNLPDQTYLNNIKYAWSLWPLEKLIRWLVGMLKK